MGRASFILLLSFLVSLLAACGSEDRPPPRRALVTGVEGAAPSGSSGTARPAPSAPPGPTAWPRHVEAPTQAPAGAPPVAEREAPRDLDRELTLALSGMSSCLSGVEDGPARTRIQVRARVLAHGAVGQVDVSAPGLPDEARRCFERVASAARLSAPVPGAPRTVTASVLVEKIEIPPPAMREEPLPRLPGIPIDDPPGLPIAGPEGQPIGEAPGVEIAGPRGQEISDAPGLEITGPEGVAISH
jgi:hypothetical protein